MIVTAIFDFFGSLAFNVPLWAYIVGALCLFDNKGILVLLYGLFLCIAMGAAFWVYLIGVICIFLDVIIMSAR